MGRTVRAAVSLVQGATVFRRGSFGCDRSAQRAWPVIKRAYVDIPRYRLALAAEHPAPFG